MRIAIDVRTIFVKRTGVGYYVYNLMNTLTRIDKENDYWFITGPDFRTNHNFLKFFPRAAKFIFDNFVIPLKLYLKRIDIYHSPAYLLPLMNFNYKKIVTIHDLGFILLPHSYALTHSFHLRLMTAWSLKKADRIIAVSKSTQKDLIFFFPFCGNKTSCIYEGVNSKFHIIEDKSKIEEIKKRYKIDSPFILFVGTPDLRKNIDRLINAFCLVRKKFQQKIKLVLVGVKKKKSFVTETIQKYGLEADIIQVGYVNEEEMVLFYNATEMFVFPSLYEGFGLPILEAMACGAPVITSNISSMPEVAGNAALLVDPYNIKDISDKICQILTNDELKNSLIKRGLERVKEFSWEKCAREAIRIYEAI